MAKMQKNEKHPTATYPRAKLKLPKGVDPSRKRAAPKKNAKRRRNPDAVAPAAQPMAPPPAPPAPAPVAAAAVPAPPPAAMPATKNPASVRSFTWQGVKYTVGMNYGVAYYRKGNSPWASVREALADKRTKPALRAHLKAATHELEQSRNKAAEKEAAKVARLVKKVKARSSAWTEGQPGAGKTVRAARRTGPAGGRSISKATREAAAEVKRAAREAARAAKKNPLSPEARAEIRKAVKEAAKEAAREYAARPDVKAAKKAARAVAKAANRAKRSAARAKKNPSKVAKPKRQPTKRDYARIVKLFKQYVRVFAAKYPLVTYVGLKVDPKIHDSARHFAMTGITAGETAPTVHIAPELAFEPVTVQRGIIIHELAHAVRALKYLPSPKGYDANERATDRLAEKVTGLKVYYDSRGVEVAGKGARGTTPRPAGLR